MIIRSVGTQLFHAGGRTDGWMDGQTDMTEPMVAFCNFSNGPKKTNKPKI